MTAALVPAPTTPRVAADGSVRFLAAVTGVPDEVDDLIVPGSSARTTGTTSSAGSPRLSSCYRVIGACRALSPTVRPGRGRPVPCSCADCSTRPAGRAKLRWRTCGYGANSAFSIGFETRRSRQRGALRLIEDLDLFEVSTGVLHSAHPLARLVDDPGPLETKALPMRAGQDHHRVSRQRVADVP